MAKRGRKKHNDAGKQWTITVPESVALEVEDLLRDPLTGRVSYGTRTKLITKLLKPWVLAQKAKLNAAVIDLDQLDNEV